MRISGKERDFYDAAASYDTSTEQLHWHREFKNVFYLNKTHEGKEEAFVSVFKPLLKKLLPAYSKTLVSSEYFTEACFRTPYNKSHIQVSMGYIFFCGKIYPYAQITDSLEKNKDTFYSYDSLKRAFEKKDALEDLNIKSRYYGIPSVDRSRNSFRNLSLLGKIEMFLEQDLSNIDCHALHLVDKKPVIIYNPKYHDSNDDTTIEHKKSSVSLNGRLGDYTFSKVMDNYTCVQELEMYLGNNLVTVDSREEFSDKTKIVSHGFDLKSSFRKEKTKHR
tara:strand:+ start:5719 stop:6549 length:831 start_codon:yes stop_codon:yes gene_type:complete